MIGGYAACTADVSAPQLEDRPAKVFPLVKVGGAEGIRTPDPLTARLGRPACHGAPTSLTCRDAVGGIDLHGRGSAAVAIRMRCQRAANNQRCPCVWRLQCNASGSNARSHPRDPGPLLACPGGVNPEPPIPLPDYDVTGAELHDVTMGGIGARSGVDAVRAR